MCEKISLEDYYKGLKLRECEFPAELRQGYEAVMWDIENILKRFNEEEEEDA